MHHPTQVIVSLCDSSLHLTRTSTEKRHLGHVSEAVNSVIYIIIISGAVIVFTFIFAVFS